MYYLPIASWWCSFGRFWKPEKVAHKWRKQFTYKHGLDHVISEGSLLYPLLPVCFEMSSLSHMPSTPGLSINSPRTIDRGQ